MKNCRNKKILKKALILLTSLLIIPFFSGCVSGAVSFHVTSFPTKIVYQIGEKPDFSGLAIETTNTDGTNTMVHFSESDISEVDTSTVGTKKVTVTKGNLSTAFNIYVANVVINDSDKIKAKFLELVDGDVVYLRAGNYMPKSSTDTSFKDIEITKSLTIVGDGCGKTKFYGNFLLGATLSNGVYTKISNFEGVKILNIGFELTYQIKDNFINYNGPYGTADTNGAIRTFDTKNILISNCSFNGYTYGVFGDNANGLSILNCKFRYIHKNGVYIATDTANTEISKNIFMDIGSNFVIFDGEKQDEISGLELSFALKGVKGVIVAQNTFTRIGLHTGSAVYYDENSKNQSNVKTDEVYKLTYLNNSSIMSLKSSTTDDLEVSGIILSTNNFGETLCNIRLGTTSKNSIDQNGVIVIS